MKKWIQLLMPAVLTALILYGFLEIAAYFSRLIMANNVGLWRLWSLGAPALGSSTGGLLALACMIIRKSWGVQLACAFFVRALRLFYLPTLNATLFWLPTYRGIVSLICLLCMVLFWLHPVGWQAAPYAFYWLLPVVVWALGLRSVWGHALGSTFAAHALGSILFLYATPLTPAYWLALMPIVAVERLGAVCVMMSMWYGVKVIQSISGKLTDYFFVSTKNIKISLPLLLAK